MSAIVKPLRSPRPVPDVVRSAFLAHAEATLGLSFPPDVDFYYCDEGGVRRATPYGDKHANKFWYVARDQPFIQIRFGHYPSDGGATSGRVFEFGSRPPLSDAQTDELKARQLDERRQLAAERQRQEHVRRAEVSRDWETAQPITTDFAYVKRKGIAEEIPVDWRLSAHRFKREHSTAWGTSVSRRHDEPALMLPLRKFGRPELLTAEFISADGEKDYPYGLSTNGACYIFGEHQEGRPVYICEGAATAWTVKKMTGCMTLRAGSAGNMKAVAKDVRQHYGPSAQIVICAERGNGYGQAVEAAQAVAGAICTPPFEECDEGSDFNDYWLLSRHEASRDEATREALEKFQQPPSTPPIGTEDAVFQAFIDSVNGEYFVGLRWGVGTQIGRWHPDGTFSRIAKEDLSIALANRRVPGMRKPPHLLWLDHHNRREYREVAYDPELQRLDSKLDLNLWTGWAVVANSEGCWDLLKAHIRDNICAGEPRAYEYIFKWMAYVVQHPGRACGVAAVLRGPQGCGKGTLFKALLKLFGRHGKHFNRAEHLTGSFTAHLEYVSFAFCDEVGWAGDHEFNDTLKALITEPRIQIHPKGKQMYDVPNTLNFGFATNREHAMHVTGDNRRMFLVEVHDAWADLFGEGKAAARERYFTALHLQLESGGYGAMLHDLLSMNLTDFRIDAFPRTRAAAEQVEMSLDSLSRYIVRLLREAVWRLVDVESEWVDGERVDKRLLFSGYLEFARSEGERYPAREAQFWKRLRDVTGDPWKQIEAEVRDKATGQRIRRRDVVLPSLQAARAHAMPRLGVDT